MEKSREQLSFHLLYRGRSGEAKTSLNQNVRGVDEKDEWRGRRHATRIFAKLSRVSVIIYVTFKVISLFDKKCSNVVDICRWTIRLATPSKHANINKGISVYDRLQSRHTNNNAEGSSRVHAYH